MGSHLRNLWTAKRRIRNCRIWYIRVMQLEVERIVEDTLGLALMRVYFVAFEGNLIDFDRTEMRDLFERNLIFLVEYPYWTT